MVTSSKICTNTKKNIVRDDDIFLESSLLAMLKIITNVVSASLNPFMHDVEKLSNIL